MLREGPRGTVLERRVPGSCAKFCSSLRYSFQHICVGTHEEKSMSVFFIRSSIIQHLREIGPVHFKNGIPTEVCWPAWLDNRPFRTTLE